jgi:hypothetical protein
MPADGLFSNPSHRETKPLRYLRDQQVLAELLSDTKFAFSRIAHISGVGGG